MRAVLLCLSRRPLFCHSIHARAREGDVMHAVWMMKNTAHDMIALAEECDEIWRLDAFVGCFLTRLSVAFLLLSWLAISKRLCSNLG